MAGPNIFNASSRLGFYAYVQNKAMQILDWHG